MTGRLTENELVERMRYLVDRHDGDRWVVERDDSGTHLLSFRSTEEIAVLATFNDDALPPEIEIVELALQLARCFLRVGDKAARVIANLRGDLQRAARDTEKKNYSANAAITVKEARFWRFLETTSAGGPVKNQTAADTRLKSILAINSKSQLNDDPQAARRWLDLRRSYENWKG